jgi:hypothetical protein
MHRIIYLDIDLGYKFADVKNQLNLLSKELSIAGHGYHVVCVLDLAHEIVVKKCDTFSAHAEFIKSCYPNIALSQLMYAPITEAVQLTLA